MEKADNKFQICELEIGFKRGDETITKVTLRRPKAGELRHLNLQDLFQADVSAVLTLLPRISDPIMTPQECEDLDPIDLMELGGAIKGFFLSRAMKEMIVQTN
ncbi:phage tail assembly protein [Sphingopyxis yananensis]|uniref:phage tail assembly protein n=1 Tax=Sphingopyxis yananensis TaxID=2886687 RepID=UPI001D102C2E|nr:phage tail assembly protein [Sphingopyxis yananensis]MCC2602545.1 phage tail assembly protein [Sphingopyxis yananensis]